MTQHSIQLTMASRPADCHTASDSQITGQSAMNVTGLRPGDTLQWSLDGTYKNGDFGPYSSTFQGIRIRSCTTKGQDGRTQDVTVTDYLGGASSGTIANMDCPSPIGVLDFKLTAGQLTVKQTAHDHPVNISYHAYFQSGEPSGESAFNTFSVAGSLTLNPVVLVQMQPASGATQPSTSSDQCCKCGTDINDHGSLLPPTIGPGTSVVWKWDTSQSFPGWTGTTQLQGLVVNSDAIQYELLTQTHLHAPEDVQPLTEFFTGPVGAFSCPCGQSNANGPNKVVYDSKGTPYAASNGVVQLDIGALDTLQGVPQLHTIGEETVTVTYTLWFTTIPSGGSTPIWWAFDPTMELDRDSEPEPMPDPIADLAEREGAAEHPKKPQRHKLGRLRIRVK